MDQESNHGEEDDSEEFDLRHLFATIVDIAAATPIEYCSHSLSSSDISSNALTPFSLLYPPDNPKAPASDKYKATSHPDNSRVIKSTDVMPSLIRIKPFRGANDGSEDPSEYLDDIECAAKTLEWQKDPTSMAGLERSQRRFFHQNLSEDGDAACWWQYVLRTDEKQSYSKIKESFLARYGTTSTAAQSRFEIQNEIMATRQQPGEPIASDVRWSEKLSKRVPAELDSMMALCFIIGIADEARKADVSYIMQSHADTTFRGIVEIVKAKYRVIGELDPFRKCASQKHTAEP